jgi:hypothetical protein
MKTIKTYGSMFLLAALMLGTVSTLDAQGRGNGRDNNPGRGHGNENPGRRPKNENSGRDRSKQDFKHRDNDRDHYARDSRDSRRDYSSHDRYHYGRHVTYNYHRYRRPVWAPVYGYRYNTRYIYYNDYNVYYDCNRDVFVTWTGRRWVITNRVPDFMFRVNFSSAVVTGVDYWDDDFDFYLERRRPAYISIQANF